MRISVTRTTTRWQQQTAVALVSCRPQPGAGGGGGYHSITQQHFLFCHAVFILFAGRLRSLERLVNSGQTVCGLAVFFCQQQTPLDNWVQ